MFYIIDFLLLFPTGRSRIWSAPQGRSGSGGYRYIYDRGLRVWHAPPPCHGMVVNSWGLAFATFVRLLALLAPLALLARRAPLAWRGRGAGKPAPPRTAIPQGGDAPTTTAIPQGGAGGTIPSPGGGRGDGDPPLIYIYRRRIAVEPALLLQQSYVFYT